MANVLKRFSTAGQMLCQNVPCRYYAAKKRPLPVGKKIHSTVESIASKGFLRSTNEYIPPVDVSSRLGRICSEAGVSDNVDTHLDDPAVRFTILNQCHKEFNHGIPNSILCTISTVGDIQKFYETSVDVTTPYDALQRIDLPENLHIQSEAVRFHPETDTLFNGISAFPQSSTLVTGLKYKKKYKGYIASKTWY